MSELAGRGAYLPPAKHAENMLRILRDEEMGLDFETAQRLSGADLGCVFVCHLLETNPFVQIDRERGFIRYFAPLGSGASCAAEFLRVIRPNVNGIADIRLTDQERLFMHQLRVSGEVVAIEQVANAPGGCVWFPAQPKCVQNSDDRFTNLFRRVARGL